MLKRIRQLPSPALVISAIALVVAIGGGSAALAITDNAKDKKIAKKVANKQITKRAPSLSVGHASTASNASALGGEPPSAYKPLAWGTLSNIANATLDQGKSHNLTATKGTQAGTYCFNLGSGTPTNVQVTVRVPDGGVANAVQYANQVVMNPAAGTCATPSQFAVYNVVGNAYVDGNMFILVF